MMDGINNSLKISASALGVFGTGMQVAAHNVANVSTDGFMPQRTVYATGANGIGVELDAVLTQDGMGEINPNINNRNDRVHGDLAHSGTDVAKEFVHMIEMRNAFEANALAVRTADELTGIISDIIA